MQLELNLNNQKVIIGRDFGSAISLGQQIIEKNTAHTSRVSLFALSTALK